MLTKAILPEINSPKKIYLSHSNYGKTNIAHEKNKTNENKFQQK